MKMDALVQTACFHSSCMFLPAGPMPPVVVGVVEALAESQCMTDKLLRLALVCHLLLFGLAL